MESSYAFNKCTILGIPIRNIYHKTTILETKDFFNFICIFIK